ncbi:CGNR zinc finger domain-containing protein [Calidithermus chliarophilus]|uniref:CGNR zinc finger domain-containing protein n=1 Tax=Calidithermus chliarophilus TaxID=52023 RepID=UPI00041BAE31|nr:ABATE domain-containing protein [Calidithermus chliarophilus]
MPEKHQDLTSLCLDFANAVGERPERFRHYGDLLAWAAEAGVLNPLDRLHLQTVAERQPEQAAWVLARALALREAVYTVFSAVAAGRPAPAEGLERLNDVLAEALCHQRLEPAEGGYTWGWEGLGDALDSPLWPVARSAAELLTSDRLPRVRECDSPTCNWLFLDYSKNHSRRWCSMSSCGNRAKARRHYQRLRGEGVSDADGR